MNAWRAEPSDQSARWLSRELAELLADPASCAVEPGGEPGFDVLVIGSGYGGAVAAAAFAGCSDASGRRLRVGLLERGREYLPGSFPSGMADLPTQLRGRFGDRRFGGEGLFDLRLGADINVVQANGLGGGSLINAGVMEVPKPEVFGERWPAAWRSEPTRQTYYDEACRLLGATVDGQPNDIGRHATYGEERLPAKAQVLKSLLRGTAPPEMPPHQFRKARITVAMEDRPTVAGVQLKACKLCGDCATGCNYGAKESLDTNLLVRAHRRGAELYCGATVLRLQRPPGRRDCWSVLVTHTDEKLRRHDSGPRWITARRVILAAGTLGSTEILLRSQRAAPELWFSSQLGQRFSGNGDTISFGYDYGPGGQANAVANEDDPPAERQVGPTITGVVDARWRRDRSGLPDTPFVIEEMAVPGALRRVAEEMITTADTLQALGACDQRGHEAGHPEQDPYAVHPQRIRNMSLFAVMGDDGADGTLRLAGSADSDRCDGHVEVVWPGIGRRKLFDEQLHHLTALAQGAGHGGRTLPNPMWRFLPESMGFLIGNQRGPLVTVHPLGGCAIGASVEQGVVDEFGRVFDPRPTAPGQGFHVGLAVLDGSIVPGALSTNPALTITALALRAVETLRAEWGCVSPEAQGREIPEPRVERPQLADVEAQIIARRQTSHARTVAGVTERLAGPLRLRDAQGLSRECWVELTLTYAPLRLEQLFRPDGQGRLSGAQLSVGGGPESSGRLRIFRMDQWRQLQEQGLSTAERERREQLAARSYELSGTLTILEREARAALSRTLRGGCAWLRNRGLRDTVQALVAGLGGRLRGEHSEGPGAWERAKGMVQLASHAGEVRLFRYDLRIGDEEPLPADAEPPARYEPPAVGFVGGSIHGRKRITYARPSNPWRQLQELQLESLAEVLDSAAPRRLILDPQYLAARGRPLLRIESQRDHVEALMDFASLGAYFLRMLLTIHLWTLRKPDAPRHRPVNRLPGLVPGLPPPEIHWIDVDELAGAPVRMRLARYRGYGRHAELAAQRPPVLLIHGYSASGTTYAHPALKPGLAPYLAKSGREVWVADLRSSAGLPTGAHPWTFEQIALADIPAAVDFIWWRSGQRQVDVLAHCMGAVMLSMALLSAEKTSQEIEALLRTRDGSTPRPDRFRCERATLQQRIRRVLLSQNGPVMVMSQQNIFRGYVMSYLEQLLGPLRYDFRPEPGQGLAAELLDRFLGSMPYPDGELRRENPGLKPWRSTDYVATRHRMDALYGRTFSLENLSDEVLDHIDDFFGPLNLDTVSQVIHFSQHRSITNRAGRNRFVSRQSLEQLWPFETLGLHGRDNGLADIATLYRVEAVMEGAGRRYKAVAFEGLGHQDCLIGKDAGRVYSKIRQFLDAAATPLRAAPPYYVAEPPWLGPMLSRQADGSVLVGLGASPQLGRPAAICMLPVQQDNGRWAMQPLGLAPDDTLWVPGDTDTDWLALPLRDWAQRPGVRHLLLLAVYPQPACMSGPAFDPGETNAASLVWPAQATAFDGDDSEREAMAKAILGALRDLQAAPGEPPGLIHLPPRGEDQDEGLCLALGSCQYPPGILNEKCAHESWQHLNRRLDGAEEAARPELLVLTGDQIYVDATAGLFDPTQADDRYRKPYETWLRSREVRDTLRRLPLVTMLDDHEIDDNWEPLAPDAPAADHEANEQLRERGVRNFLRFQRPVAVGDPPRPADRLWLKLEPQGIPIFLADTRTRRESRVPGAAEPGPALLLRRPQWEDLCSWLLHAPCDRPKLIVSPGVMLPRHRRAVPAALAFGEHDRCQQAARRSDAWDGYPDAMYALLDFIARNRIHGVVFLSGDEHLGLCTTATIERVEGGQASEPVTVHSIHAPGLNTPYRFANARSPDLVLNETLHFHPSGPGVARDVKCHCTVKTQVMEGAGFALVALRPGETPGEWALRCEFDGESGVGTESWGASVKFA